jgi:hypothetical protein
VYERPISPRAAKTGNLPDEIRVPLASEGWYCAIIVTFAGCTVALGTIAPVLPRSNFARALLCDEVSTSAVI